MKQVLQSYASGKLSVADVPSPGVRAGYVGVQTVNSAVSVGTEKLSINLARKSLVGKALARPDLVRRAITKARTDGIQETLQQATSLDSFLALGNSCAGRVIQAGEGVTEFQVGDRVACAGQGYASHAQAVCVPKNLCVRIPDSVGYESAAFAALGAIALHGVRVAQPALGETIAIIGLGLLGQLSVQILKASGCRVFGIDLVPDKVALAQELGADAAAVSGRDNLHTQVSQFTHGVGADAVLILASTPSNEPITLASEIARDRGRIVALGLVKLDVPRNLFYEKELTLTVSRSSGPGIYDLLYEQKGIDYPLPYVRWTMQRNMQEFLDLVAQSKVCLDRIISHRFPIEDAKNAYDLLMGKTKEPYLGIVLTYQETEQTKREPVVALNETPRPSRGARGESKSRIRVGVIGGGLYAKGTLLPALRGISSVDLRGIATATGPSASHAGKKFGFAYCTNDYQQLLDDREIDAIMILTRHNLHARMIAQALQSGKHVFVEKPLALNMQQLEEITDAYAATRKDDEASHGLQLMVGFNRRFSPSSMQAKKWLLEQRGPFAIHCRVNAGSVPRNHWSIDPEEGGGRIVGEICHFVDLIQFLAGALPTRVHAESLRASHEDVAITLRLDDGSIASILYTARGDRALPRERIEVFTNQTVCVLNNFKALTLIRNGRTTRKQSLNLDKGHRHELEVWVDSIRTGKPAVEFQEYVRTTLTTFAIEESLRTGKPVDIVDHADLAS